MGQYELPGFLPIPVTQGLQIVRQGTLPGHIYRQVAGLTQVVFKAPKAELPSYWRQVGPDLYKEELAGYMAKEPGYVHQMSSDMAASYMDAVLRTGDPLFVDGTGAKLEAMKSKMDAAKRAGYKTSLVFVYVPLVVNQIRNLTRERNVSPMVVLKQWQVLQQNYVALKGYADKSKVIINRNDQADKRAYYKAADRINQAIAKETGYDNLYEFIAAYSPSELGDWGNFISPEKWR
jgi:predicted kinase